MLITLPGPLDLEATVGGDSAGSDVARRYAGWANHYLFHDRRIRR
jgi:hypothetical protein